MKYSELKGLFTEIGLELEGYVVIYDEDGLEIGRREYYDNELVNNSFLEFKYLQLEEDAGTLRKSSRLIKTIDEEISKKLWKLAKKYKMLADILASKAYTIADIDCEVKIRETVKQYLNRELEKDEQRELLDKMRRDILDREYARRDSKKKGLSSFLEVFSYYCIYGEKVDGWHTMRIIDCSNCSNCEQCPYNENGECLFS